MKIIAIEEHFTTEEQIEYLRSILDKDYPVQEVVKDETAIDIEVRWVPASNYSSSLIGSNAILEKLLDVGEGRLKEMDDNDIAMEVLSLVSPGVQVLDTPAAIKSMKKQNDKLSEIVRKYPQRFAGLATLAPQSPGEAADELERAVKELGLKGASINSHVKGNYLDDEKFWVIFERAEKLNVPVNIHPRAPSPDMIKPYLTYPILAAAMWGFGAEVSLHALRLICSGVFDRHPGLKIILGHLGESLPYWIWRLDRRWQQGQIGNKISRKPSEYLRDNFVISTSGMFWHMALTYCCSVLGAENILFAVDHPFESNAEGVQFIKTAPISDSDKEKICHLNAEKLLKL